MIPHINIETIMGDPLLQIALLFLVMGPLFFLVALVKLFKSKKTDEPMPLDIAEEPKPEPLVVPSYMEEAKEETPPPPAQPTPQPQQTPQAPPPPAVDKTMVMPSGMGEVQGQIEIAFSQIKNLNKKVAQMEGEVENLSRLSANKLEANELKEIPMNPADFTQKLLKLAEHVIVLEKEVARLKAAAKTAAAPNGGSAPEENEQAPESTAKSATPPSTPKSPIMPI